MAIRFIRLRNSISNGFSANRFSSQGFPDCYLCFWLLPGSHYSVSWTIRRAKSQWLLS